jgi:hypothetical protein
VAVLLNPNRPRDRSHYEHFAHSHDVFYRDVEATSVTPFSERALERGLPAITVALARHLSDALTHARSAGNTAALAEVREAVAEAMRRRVASSLVNDPAHADARANEVAEQVRRIIDDWCTIAERRGQMEYGHEEGDLPPLLRTPLDPELLELGEIEVQFKANRSLRDVEPSALLLKDRYQSTTRA